MVETDKPAPLTIELVDEYLKQIRVWEDEITEGKGITTQTTSVDEFLKLRNKALEHEPRLIPLVYAKLGISELLPNLRGIPNGIVGLAPEEEEFEKGEFGTYFSTQGGVLRLAERFLIAKGSKLSAITVVSDPVPLKFTITHPRIPQYRKIDGGKAYISLLYRLMEYVETHQAVVFGWIPIPPTPQSPSCQDPSQP